MTQTIDIPQRPPLELEHLVLDQNGTLSDRGVVIYGVSDRLGRLKQRLTVHILSADTFGTLDELTEELQVEGHRVQTGEDKRAFVSNLGGGRCVAIGNGQNDIAMLNAVALGVVVIGPEGASAAAIAAADIVCTSILDALDLLLDPRILKATLRP